MGVKVNQKFEKFGMGDFWLKSNFEAVFWTLSHNKKSLIENASGYGLFKYIGEEKKGERKITEKMVRHNKTPPRPNFSNF